MQVKDIMTRKVQAISPSTPVAEAAEIMKAHDVGALPVCEGNKLIGMLTDRDIIVRSTAEGFHPETIQAEEVMTRHAVYGFEDQDVGEASRIMEENQIRRLPILNREKCLVGVLSLGDIAVGTQNKELAGEALREISEPAPSKPLPGRKRE
ncbi:MAG TPA: CBS domain-containing protein [Candidatus Udaeobacter sp.]|jgi:CBS domain-containing protein|nr:CBS domain-containing protein [Candidatus Udaeobacter sp.]